MGKADEHHLAVNVLPEVEYISLKCSLCSSECGPYTDVHHGPLHFHAVLQPHLHSIHTRCRNQFVETGRVKIGRGKTHPTSFLIPFDHLPHDGIRIAEAHLGHFHLTGFQKRAYH